jgi:hypothetical protein
MSSGGEGEWPTVDELKKSVDMPNDDFDPQLDRHLDAAIEQVKLDVGDWDEVVDEPDASLAQAALLLAIRIASDPSQAPRLLARDAGYERLLKGHRRRFSIA